MKLLLLSATVLLATNAYIICRLLDHSDLQINNYNNNHFYVSNYYTDDGSTKFEAPTIVAKTKDISVALQIEHKETSTDEGLLYNATAWLQDKLVFFKYFSIYSSYD